MHSFSSKDIPATRDTLRFCGSGIRALEDERRAASALERPKDWDRHAVQAFIRKVVGRGIISTNVGSGFSLSGR